MTEVGEGEMMRVSKRTSGKVALPVLRNGWRGDGVCTAIVRRGGGGWLP